jgi:hypothetical protein
VRNSSYEITAMSVWFLDAIQSVMACLGSLVLDVISSERSRSWPSHLRISLPQFATSVLGHTTSTLLTRGRLRKTRARGACLSDERGVFVSLSGACWSV